MLIGVREVEIDIGVVISENARENVLPFAKDLPFRVRVQVSQARALDFDELIWLLYGQGSEREAINHRKNRNGRADSQREGEDSDSGKAWGFTQRAQAEAQVVNENSHAAPAVGKNARRVNDTARSKSAVSLRLWHVLNGEWFEMPVDRRCYYPLAHSQDWLCHESFARGVLGQLDAIEIAVGAHFGEGVDGRVERGLDTMGNENRTFEIL